MNVCLVVEFCCDRDFLFWCFLFFWFFDFDLDFFFVGLVFVVGGEFVGEDFIIDGLYIGMFVYRGVIVIL